MASISTVPMAAISGQRLSPKIVFACLLAIQAAALLLVGTRVLYRELIGGQQLDVLHYYLVADALLHGHLPYRDFPLEYPPFAVVPFLLPRLALLGGSDFGAYLWALLFQSILFSTALGLIMIRLTTRWKFALPSQPALAVYAALVFLGCYLLPWRYDIFPALLTALALFCLLSGRSLAAGAWLGLGIAAKLYPIVLLPIFALYLFSQNQKRDTGRLLLGSVGAVVLCLLPFILLCPAGLLSALHYHQQRGLEIESVASGLVLLAHHAGLTPAGIVFNYGAFHLDAPWAAGIIAGLEPGFFALFALLLIHCGRAFRREWQSDSAISPESLIRFATASLLLFLTANKVFSPQYVFWLLPFAPLLRPREAIGILVLFALTTLLYPFLFDALLNGETSAVLLLNARNLLVVFLLFRLLTLRGDSSCSTQTSS